MGATRNITARCQLFLERLSKPARWDPRLPAGDLAMNDIIYIIGLIVVVMFILSALGLR
jgi:hypothetical protein